MTWHVRQSMDNVNRMAIYICFIISNFNYHPVVWMVTIKSSLNKLENIQKHTLRLVCNEFVNDYSKYEVLCFLHLSEK